MVRLSGMVEDDFPLEPTDAFDGRRTWTNKPRLKAATGFRARFVPYGRPFWSKGGEER